MLEFSDNKLKKTVINMLKGSNGKSRQEAKTQGK
jgi:hypothetical protein